MAKIQKQGIKTEAEVIADGGAVTDLPNDSQIYITALGINKTLDDAIIDGNIGSVALTVSTSSGNVAAWPITVNQYGDLTSLSLAAGTWLISFHAWSDNNGAVSTTGMQVGIGTAAGNDATGLNNATNAVEIVPISGTTGHCRDFQCANFQVTPGSTTTYYLKGIATGSITNLRVGYRMTALKIA